MKLLIAGTAHDLEGVLDGAKLGDLLELKMQTGVGMRTLQTSLARMGQYADPAELLDDEIVLRGLIALVWLCRRRAGEQVSFADASNVDLNELVWEIDDDPEPEDPTSAPTGSDRGDEHPAEKPAEN